MVEDNKKYNLIPLPILVGCIVVAILANHFSPILKDIVPFPFSLSGLVLIAIGLTLACLAIIRLRKRRTTLKLGEIPSSLVRVSISNFTEPDLFRVLANN